MERRDWVVDPRGSSSFIAMPTPDGLKRKSWVLTEDPATVEAEKRAGSEMRKKKMSQSPAERSPEMEGRGVVPSGLPVIRSELARDSPASSTAWAAEGVRSAPSVTRHSNVGKRWNMEPLLQVVRAHDNAGGPMPPL